MSRPQSPRLRVLRLDGGAALGGFRIERIVERLRAEGVAVRSLAARHVHWVAATRELDGAELGKLRSLLIDDATLLADDERAETLVVMPRLGTLSPWASKATDIAHRCGLDAIDAHRARRRVRVEIEVRAARPHEGRRRGPRDASPPRCTTA